MTVGKTRHVLLQELFAAVDGRDTDRFVTFLTDDAEFRFGSAPPVRGRGAIAEAVSGFYSTISALRHEVLNTLVDDKALACEGQVTYTRHDGSTVTLPFTNVFEFDGSLISKYKIYIDIAPLFAE